MNTELYLLGLDEGDRTCDKTTISLFKVCDNGALHLLDTFNAKNISQTDLDKIAAKFESLYDTELQKLKPENGNKWYSKVEGYDTKIKVNHNLLEQLKRLQWK